MGVQRKRVVLLWLVCVIYAPMQLQAATILLDDNDARLSSPRTAAIGGTHAALADDYTTLFSNPAGFNAVSPRFRFTELTFGLSGPIFTLSSIIFEGMKTDVTSVISRPDVSELLKSIYAGLNIIGPLSFGYVGEGLGFGVSSDIGMTAVGAGASNLTVNLTNRLLFSGGFALGVPIPESWPGTLDAGMLLKGFITGRAGFSTTILNLPNVLSSLGPDTILNEPFDLTTGIGLDLGLRWAFSSQFAAAFTAANVVAPAVVNKYASLNDFINNNAPTSRPRARIPQNLSVGMLYQPHLGALGRYITDLKLMFDYRDIIDFWAAPASAENPLLKFGLGAELQLLQALDIRAGFSQGLLAAGIGIDMTYFKLNAAMYGTELSTEPGFNSIFNILIGLEFER